MEWLLQSVSCSGIWRKSGTPGKKGYRIAQDAEEIETPDPLWLFPDKELRCRFKEVQCADGQRFDRNTEECVFCAVGTCLALLMKTIIERDYYGVRFNISRLLQSCNLGNLAILKCSNTSMQSCILELSKQSCNLSILK